MTKFEEEVKRPKKAYIDPFSKRDVDFTGVAKKFTEGAQTLKEWKEYASLLEDKLKLQQQALPVVPECVGEWIECVKGKNKNALALLDDDNMPDDVNEWLFFQRNDDNINLILRAMLDGYTVEKSDKCMVKLGALYFKCWNDIDAVFIIDDQPGAYESAFVFKKREDAEKVAQLVGGRVVKN